MWFSSSSPPGGRGASSSTTAPTDLVSLLDFAPPQGAMMTIKHMARTFSTNRMESLPAVSVQTIQIRRPRSICFSSTRKVNVFAICARGWRIFDPMTSPTLRCATRGSQATIPPRSRDRSSVRKVLKSAHFPSNQDVSDIRVEHGGASLLGSSIPLRPAESVALHHLRRERNYPLCLGSSREAETAFRNDSWMVS